MATQPERPTTDDEALLQALRAVLQPLARLAVARGMTYAPVDEIVRQAFVQAADDAHPELLPHRKVSHVATVTGLHRREVTRLVQALRDGSAKDSARPRSLVNELYTHWLSDPAYCDRKGAPRVLPRQGPAPSFESLAHTITRNVHPRTLLDELLRLGLVQVDESKDRVSAVREAIVPRGDVQRMLGYLGTNVGDHLAGAAANVQADGGRHFEQAVVGARVVAGFDRRGARPDPQPMEDAAGRDGAGAGGDGRTRRRPARCARAAARGPVQLRRGRCTAAGRRAQAKTKEIDMNPILHGLQALRSMWRRAGPGLLLTGLLLAACGGGVESGGTGSFASGPISGFGSVVVNGVHYDESAATVQDEDERDFARDGLRLGMTVEVEAGPVTAAAGDNPARAVATRVRVGSELVGAIDPAGAGTSAISVAGQSVAVSAATVIDDRIVGGTAGLVAGLVVEVYAYQDATLGRYVATRIEPKPGATTFKVRGVISQLDAQAGSFQIDGQRYVLAAGLSVPPGLANGQFVRVQLRQARDAQNRWVVTGFGRALPSFGNRQDVKLKGLINVFASATSFSVNGVPVDASAAQVGGALGPGVRVEVDGAAQDGRVVARKVTVESDDEAGQFEMRGDIATIDTATQTFTLRKRSEVVSYGGGGVSFEDGGAADLRTGVEVEVRGVLSADRTRLQATRIRIR